MKARLGTLGWYGEATLIPKTVSKWLLTSGKQSTWTESLCWSNNAIYCLLFGVFGGVTMEDFVIPNEIFFADFAKG